MLSPNFFNTVFIIPILNLLVGFYHVFLMIKVPGAFGLSIIALTVLIRLVLHPFFSQQLHTAKKMQELKPHLDKLSQKHKKDPKKLQQEQMRLYQEAGINPASGCLFMVIQIPIFIGLYNTLSLFLTHGTGAKVVADINRVMYFPFLHISNTIDPYFLGFNLVVAPNKAHEWFYYIIPLITAFLQFLQVKYSTPMGSAQPLQAETAKTNKDDKKESSTGGDFQQALNTQMKFIFPLMIGWFSYTLPVGLSLYWNIFSIFSILQYQRVNAKSQALNLKKAEK